MSRFWSPFVKDLVPYVPGEQPKLDNLIKLNTNENPFGPSPLVLAAIAAATNDALRLYPAPDADSLKTTIAEYYGVQANQVFVGNGSDEVLAHVFHGLLQHGKPVLFPDISYSFYPVYCGLYGIEAKTLPLAEDFTLSVADYAQPNGGIIFPNPNAPTGIALPLEQIEQLLRANPESVVVVDEAYVDFGAQPALVLLKDYPNLLIVRTLSKSRSLAGLRVGFAMGNANLIDALCCVRDSINSYPLDRLALAGAEAAFRDEAYFDRTRRAVIDSREQVVVRLREMGFEVLPSAANFVFVRHPGHDAAQLAQGLREQRVIVRHFAKPRIDQFLRITIGTQEQNARLIEALQALI